MSLHFFVPAIGEGLAARLRLRIFDRKLEAFGPGESAFAEGYGGTRPGPGVPLLLKQVRRIVKPGVW